MNFEISKVTREHLPEIAALETVCFSEPWSESALELFLKEGAVAFAAVENGTLLGYIGMLLAPGEGQILNLAVFPAAREILNLAVFPAARGRGVAKGLVARLIAEAQARGLESLSLEVRVSNLPAIRLYESAGFQTAGVRKGFYRRPAEDGLVMIKSLSANP